MRRPFPHSAVTGYRTTDPSTLQRTLLVRDNGANGAAVLTRSTNFTLTDTGTNPATNTAMVGNNLDHIVVLHGQHAVNPYREEFDRVPSAPSVICTKRHEPRPSEFQLAKIRIKPIFALEQ